MNYPYLSSWKNIREPSYEQDNIRVAVREDLYGKKLYIDYNLSGYYDFGGHHIYHTLDDAIIDFDKWLLEQGWVFIAQERFDKLKTLL
jgi:hypothetical protein